MKPLNPTAVSTAAASSARVCLGPSWILLPALLGFPAPGWLRAEETPAVDSAVVFRWLDADGDGRVNAEEFARLGSRGRGQVTIRPEMRELLLRRLDTDEGGSLTWEEFRGLAGLRTGHSVLDPDAPAAGGSVPPDAGTAGLYKEGDAPYEAQSVEHLVLRDEVREKDLQVRVGHPSGKGPFPVLVFAHGATGTKDDYQPLVQHWVRHGYVTIQANHSDSRALAGMTETGQVKNKFLDWASRPQDVAFLLDSLPVLAERVPGLGEKMDVSRTGVGGHSFGAHTAQLIAGTTTVDGAGRHTSHADQRPKAFVLISPQGRGLQLDERSWEAVTRPVLSVTGSKDWGRQGEAVDWRLDPFRLAPSPDKALVYIEGAHHDFGGIGGGVSYRNAGPRNPDQVAWVQAATLAFWDAHLKDDAAAKAWLRSGALERVSKRAVRVDGP